jgi:hypothetical protein
MNSVKVRQAATQVERAAYNSNAAALLMIECAVGALAIGIAMKSLAWGLGTIVGLFVLTGFPPTQRLTGYAFSFGWGALAFYITNHVDPSEPIAAWIAAGCAIVATWFVHESAFQWMRDFL